MALFCSDPSNVFPFTFVWEPDFLHDLHLQPYQLCLIAIPPAHCHPATLLVPRTCQAFLTLGPCPCVLCQERPDNSLYSSLCWNFRETFLITLCKIEHLSSDSASTHTTCFFLLYSYMFLHWDISSVKANNLFYHYAPQINV